jgi:hypothetical protein
LRIKTSNTNSKNLKESERASEKTRTCSKCDVEKPLDIHHFQIVKYFRGGFSFYCNECNKPKPKEEK